MSSELNQSTTTEAGPSPSSVNQKGKEKVEQSAKPKPKKKNGGKKERAKRKRELQKASGAGASKPPPQLMKRDLDAFLDAVLPLGGVPDPLPAQPVVAPVVVQGAPPQQPVGPPAVVVDPVEPPPLAWPRWKTAMASWTVRVTPRHHDIPELKKRGFHVEERGEGGHPNAHAVSAEMRRMATARALTELYQRGCRNVLSVYGSKRDPGILAALQGAPGECREQMVLTIHRPLITTADYGRVPDLAEGLDEVTCVETMDGDYDGYLFVDVYALDGLPLAPRPLNVFNGPMVFVRHQFNGACGTVENEGGWIRLGNTVLFKPDARSPAYAAHDPLDWMSSDGWEHGVGWTTVHYVGPYAITYALPIPTKPRIGKVGPPPQMSWYMHPVPRLPEGMSPTMMALVSSLVPLKWLPAERVLIDVRLKTTFQRWMVGKSLTHYGFKQLATEMAAFIEERSDYKLLDELFPELFPSYTTDVVWVVFLDDVHNKARRATTARAVFGTTIEQHNTDMVHMAQGIPVDWRLKAAVYVAGGALLMWLARWLPSKFRRQASLLQSIGPLRLEIVFLLATVWGNLRRCFETSLCPCRRRVQGLIGRACGVMRSAASSLYDGVKSLGSLVGNHPRFQAVKQGAITQIQPTIQVMQDPTFWDALGFGAFSGAPFGAMTVILLRTLTDGVAHAARIGLLAGIEEFVKATFPQAGELIFAAEVTLTTAMRGIGPGLMQLLVSGIIHLVLPRFYNPVAVWLFHTAWNLSVIRSGAALPVASLGAVLAARQRSSDAGVWRGWKQAVYEDPWPTRVAPTVAIDLPTGVYAFTADDARVPCQTYPYFTAKSQDPDLEVKGTLTPELEPLPRVYHAAWPLNVAGYVPARSDANLLGVLQSRILVPPPMAPRDQALNWKGVQVLIRHQQPLIHWDEHVDEWFAHLDKPVQRDRARAAVEVIRTGYWRGVKDPAVRKVKVFVKTNEMLLKVGDRFGMKPRPIANVDPRVQAFVGPSIYEATKRLGDEWPFDFRDPFMVGEWRVHMTYGAKSTDDALTQWMRQALEMGNGSVAIIVAGDDSLVVIRDFQSKLHILTGDASMYDQSESTGPLKHQYKGMRKIGCHTDVTEVLWSVAHGTYIAVSRDGTRKIKIRRILRPFRDTGGGDTSYGNSWVMGSAWADVIARMGRSVPAMDTLRKLFGRLGLDMKLYGFDTPYLATFLKGIWYPCGSGPVWGPLPSRVLKMGKTLVDPRSLYKGSYTEAMHAFLHDVAEGYSHFLSVPVLRAMVSQGLACKAKRLRPRASLPKPFFGVDPGFNCQRERVVDWYWIAKHYGVAETDLSEFEALLTDAPVFSFIVHPLAPRMAIVDYS